MYIDIENYNIWTEKGNNYVFVVREQKLLFQFL